MNLAGSIKLNRCRISFISSVIIILIYYATFNNKQEKYFQKSSNEINLRKLLIGSIQAAINGGREILLLSNSSDTDIKSKGKTAEGMNDPVTLADFNSHCVMKRGLHRIFPSLEIISEEDSSEVKCPDQKLFDLDPNVLNEMNDVPDETVLIENLTVWIDPLDATHEFTEHLFQYVTTMVCVALNGVPIIGVIHSPFTSTTTWSWTGKASSSNLIKIKREKHKNPIIIKSRSHAGDVEKLARDVFGKNVEVISAAGSGYKALKVAFNEATFYIHSTKIKKWDICAGNAIISGINGKMTNLKGESIEYDAKSSPINDFGILASVQMNHGEIIEKIQEFKS